MKKEGHREKRGLVNQVDTRATWATERGASKTLVVSAFRPLETLSLKQSGRCMWTG